MAILSQDRQAAAQEAQAKLLERIADVLEKLLAIMTPAKEEAIKLSKK